MQFSEQRDAAVGMELHGLRLTSLPPWCARDWRPRRGSPEAKALANLAHLGPTTVGRPRCPRCITRVRVEERSGRQWTLRCPECGRVWKVRRPKWMIYRCRPAQSRRGGSGGNGQVL